MVNTETDNGYNLGLEILFSGSHANSQALSVASSLGNVSRVLNGDCNLPERELSSVRDYLKRQLESGFLGAAAQHDKEFGEKVSKTLGNLDDLLGSDVEEEVQPDNCFSSSSRYATKPSLWQRSRKAVAVAAASLATLLPYSKAHADERPVVLTNEVYRTLIEPIDTDNNGRLTGEEFRRLREYIKSETKYFMGTYDANGDGTLDGEERQKIAKNKGINRFFMLKYAEKIIEGQKYRRASEVEVTRYATTYSGTRTTSLAESSADIASGFVAGDDSISLYFQAGYGRTSRDTSISVDVDVYERKRDSSSSSAELGVDNGDGTSSDIIESQTSDDINRQTRLRVDMDLPRGTEVTIAGTGFERDSSQRTSNGEHITGPFTDISVDVDVDADQYEDGYGYGAAVTHTHESGDNQFAWGGILKYARTEALSTTSTTTTVTVGGVPTVSTDNSSSSSAPDYASLGGRARGSFTNSSGTLKAGLDFLVNTGKDVPSGQGFELTAYASQDFYKWALQALYNLDGGSSSGQLTFLFNTDMLPSEAVKNANSLLETTVDDLTFFGDQPLALRDLRFIEYIEGSDSWALQLSLGEQEDGLFELRGGMDHDLGEDRYLTWAVVIKESGIEDIIGLMAYYSWKKGEANASVGLDLRRAEIEGQEAEVQGGIGGRFALSF